MAEAAPEQEDRPVAPGVQGGPQQGVQLWELQEALADSCPTGDQGGPEPDKPEATKTWRQWMWPRTPQEIRDEAEYIFRASYRSPLRKARPGSYEWHYHKTQRDKIIQWLLANEEELRDDSDD